MQVRRDAADQVLENARSTGEEPMLRVKAITPIHLPDEEVARRQSRYNRLGGARVRINLVNLGKGAPLRLDSAEDIARSDGYVREEIGRTDPERFDAILPDCVLDPGVGEVDDSPVPLVGILRLAAGHLASLGESFAAVTRNGAIGDELRRRIVAYGLTAHLTSVELLDVDFCLISDHSGWAKAMKPLGSSLSAKGVTKLLNGCSAVEIPDKRLGGVVVVDPTELAIRLLAVAYDTGLIGARRER